MRASALIPAFNEAENIGSVLIGLRRSCPDLPVLVVDDGSTDGTAEVAMDDHSIHSIAIFPLAIPLIAGPGAMTASLLLAESRVNSLLGFLISYLPVIVVVLDPVFNPPRVPLSTLPEEVNTNQSLTFVRVYAVGILTVKLPAPSEVPDLNI